MNNEKVININFSGTTDMVRIPIFGVEMWREVFGGRVMTIEASRTFTALVERRDEIGDYASESGVYIVGDIENFDVITVLRQGGLCESVDYGVIESVDNGRAKYLYGSNLAVSRKRVYDFLCDSMDRYFQKNGGSDGLEIKPVLMNIEMILNRSERGLPWLLTWGGDGLVGLDRLLSANGGQKKSFLRREL